MANLKTIGDGGACCCGPDSGDCSELDSVKEYYGKILQSKDDLQSSACCAASAMPRYLRSIEQEIHQEVKEKFYGCGSPIPYELNGQVVLDLGSGTGRDCYMISKLVGESGRVIGVDMTAEQLEVANRHVQFHTDLYGYKQPNVSFLKGYIEDLSSLGIEDESVDIVISNCVLNLSPNKERVFSEIFRVLKPGGELYFSDIFAGSRVPKELFDDQLLRGECLSGALYLEDFRRILQGLGCADYRVSSASRVDLSPGVITEKLGMIDFFSMTLRAFKLPLEDACENYGEIATYKGTLEQSTHSFDLDLSHSFKAGLLTPVCGNTADMLSKTRFARHFEVIGDKSTHYGLFKHSREELTVGEAGIVGAPCC